MPKPQDRPTGRYAREAVKLLGLLIRRARIERRMTVQEVADRAGVSRGLVTRAEAGELRTSIGAAFEIAAVVGVRLFDLDERGMFFRLTDAQSLDVLLPRAIRASTKRHDNF